MEVGSCRCLRLRSISVLVYSGHAHVAVMSVCPTPTAYGYGFIPHLSAPFAFLSLSLSLSLCLSFSLYTNNSGQLQSLSDHPPTFSPLYTSHTPFLSLTFTIINLSDSSEYNLQAHFPPPCSCSCSCFLSPLFGSWWWDFLQIWGFLCFSKVGFWNRER